ncbi:uncharacterized protein LOC112053059 [Bicyclus anynana]|uniref:Uncharacterized protein LOC112053059 n=1 Tax=Bicyclus anynana TaxID=110368 RepID=A0A6J1NME8_BICAN|nr:uncharacterized protein LOC112053059 [Bicyclus anynana]
MRTLALLLCVAAVAAVRVPPYPLAPAAYIYRSDNGGPPSLIQLAPAPLPFVNAQPIAIEDAEEDAESYDDTDELDGELGGEGEALAQLSHERGGGSSYDEAHRSAHGEKGSKGYSSEGHHAKGASGDYGERHHEGHYHESGGKKGEHHDEADSHGSHHQSGKSYKGGDHGHKKHFSKGEDVSGYRKVFSKDEYKKDHDFYDEAAKDGHFHKHGYQKAHHGAAKGAHAAGGSAAAGHDEDDYGKAGYRTDGRVDEADAAHSAERGEDEHYHKHEEHGHKGASDEGSAYQYVDGDEDD